MNADRTPAYYAVLPGKVRYDPELRPNAKLLYAEITALADAKGFCWATNDYFARLYGLTAKSISRLISTLGDKGYLTVEVVRDPETNAVLERRLYVETPPLQKEETPPPTEDTPIHQKEETPPLQKEEKNNTSINNIYPPTPKTKKRGRKTEDHEAACKEVLDWYLAAHPAVSSSLSNFFAARKEIDKAKHSPAAYKAILSRLDRLSKGDDDVKIDLLDLAASRGWITVYPLNGQDKPKKLEKGGDWNVE